MSKKTLILISIIGVVLLILTIRTCSGSAFFKRYNWEESFEDKKNHVYGTYIIKRFLEYTSTKGRKDIDVKFSKFFEEGDEVFNGNYIFIGEAMLLDKSDAEALADFVGSGNNAIISTKVFPNTLSEKIFTPCREWVDEEVEYQGLERLNDQDKDIFENKEEDNFIASDTTLQSSETIKEKVEYEAWMHADIDYIDFVGKFNDEMRMSLDSSFRQNKQTDPIFKTFKNSQAWKRNWYYLHDSLSCMATNEMKVLGHLDEDKINYFELPYKDGSFFIHTNPLVFTNEHMLYDGNVDYVAGVLSACPQEKWYWDEYSRTNFASGRQRNGRQNFLSSKGPLTYILSQAPLAWAWYCLLAMGFLFLLFRAKRKQRVIPVLVENENTSLAFINAIGTLYFRKNDHGQLSKDQMQLWLEKIRTQFRLNTSQLDETFVTKLAIKSKVPKEEIQAILDFYKNIDNSNFVSENTMIKFYQKIKKFEIQANQKI